MMVLSWCLPLRTRVFELADSQVELFPTLEVQNRFSFVLFSGKIKHSQYFRLFQTDRNIW